MQNSQYLHPPFKVLEMTLYSCKDRMAILDLQVAYLRKKLCVKCLLTFDYKIRIILRLDNSPFPLSEFNFI